MEPYIFVIFQEWGGGGGCPPSGSAHEDSAVDFILFQLPIKVDIIKHPSECDGKSTAVHAGVICPDDVTIHTYPCIPDYRQDKVD